MGVTTRSPWLGLLLALALGGCYQATCHTKYECCVEYCGALGVHAINEYGYCLCKSDDSPPAHDAGSCVRAEVSR